MCGETAAAMLASRKATIPIRNNGLRRKRRVSTIAGMVTITVPRA